MRRLRAALSLVLLAACCCAHIAAIAPLAFADNSASSTGALPEPIPWRQSAFSIPFKVAADGASAPADVRLYVSKNRGANWDLAAQVSPQEHSFLYRAPSDGEFWFQIRTADRQGHVTPDVGGPPELRVIVDTLPPRLDVTATRGPSGEIKTSWQAVDPLLDGDSLKFEYQNSAGQWRPVAVDRPRTGSDRSTSSGTLTWFPDDAPAGALAIRAQISDRAGNVAYAQSKAEAAAQSFAGPSLPAPQSSTAQLSSSGPPALSLPATSAASSNTPQWSPSNSNTLWQNNSANNSSSINNSTSPPFGAYAQTTPGATTWPAEQSSSPWNGGNSGNPPYMRRPIPTDDKPAPQSDRSNQSPPPNRSAPSNQSALGIPDVERLAARPDWETANPAIHNQGSPATQPSSHLDTQTLSYPDTQTPRHPATQTLSHPDTQTLSHPATTLPAGVRPLMVNSRTFDMDYEVDAVGPSGIAKVELWGTQDGGQTWRSYGIDPDNRSPIRAKVEGEGLYGFRVVVQSGSGLAGATPISGDRPDIWVQVDLTKPTVELLDAMSGQSQDAGTLFIRWHAEDAALADRPITLMFSDRPTGPWSTIAAGLDNTGQYGWRPDARVPDRIYLRIEARDQAGNVGTFDASQPISIDRIRPGGRIQSAHPINDSAAISRSYSDTANGARIYQFQR